MITAILLTLSVQVPGSVGPSRDIIRLKVGTEIEGSIVRETSEYVEVRLEGGMIVGLNKSKTTEIVRAVKAPEQRAVQPDSRPALIAESVPNLASSPARWFVVHDDAGRAVGWFHESSRSETTAGGRRRFAEEWQFDGGDRVTELTLLETLDDSGRPETCFYHERVRAKTGEREVLGERIVRGVVRGEVLEVQRRTLENSTSTTYPFPAESRFPLELRHELRQMTVATEVEFPVFDPSVGEWSRHSFLAGGMRTVVLDGEKRRVRTLVRRRASQANIEWLDAASHSLRREINGTALVARPMTERAARDACASDEPTFEASLATEIEERFGLWMPNPMWKIQSQRIGEVYARCEAYNATMSLVALDPVLSAPAGGGTPMMPTVVDTVERWLRVAHPDIEFGAREQTRLRDRVAVRVRGTYAVRAEGRILDRVCDVVVGSCKPVKGQETTYLAFCADCPKGAVGELAADFERALSSLELRPEGIAVSGGGVDQLPAAAGR